MRGHAITMVTLVSGLGCGGGAGGTTSEASSDTGTSSALESTGGTGTGGSGAEPVLPPASFRFDCVDVQVVGDADGSAFQAQLLESAWNQDIADYRLDIVVDLRQRDENTATWALLSGLGTGPGDLCADGPTASAPFASDFSAGITAFARDPRGTSDKTCSVARTQGQTDGTYTFALPASEVLYIHAITEVGAAFNCTLDAAQLDAVPLHAVDATFTQAGSELAGRLRGCLVEVEADGLCSCFGTLCTATGPEDLNPEGACVGCPRGTTPILELLAGIGPSERCSTIMGEPAFDVQLGFTALALPNVIQPCTPGG